MCFKIVNWVKVLIFNATLAFITVSCTVENRNDHKLPNIIIVIADDLGYGDVGAYGNDIAKTPSLDEMAKNGVKFERFYVASPVCSPTRGSILTGRHPYRYGIPWAGRYALPFEEITIAEALKTVGYTTGHFGKWHVGGLSRTVNQSYHSGGPTAYSPPWENGFDVSFSTEAMMPTYNPYYHVGGEFGTDDYRHVQTEVVETGQTEGGFRWKDHYWTGPGQIVDEWLDGDDSKIIMDRAINFIEKSANEKTPFFSMIAFHAPHTPIVAGTEYRELYPDLDIQSQHWYGMLTAMDKQVGRLREKIRELKIEEDTILWFISDNGPSYIHDFNSAGELRGHKAELFEGGIRVPAILEWPSKISESFVSVLPVHTNDFYPTFLELIGIEIENQPILDGKNIMDLILLDETERPDALMFQSPLPSRLISSPDEKEEQFAVIKNQFKLISMDDGETFQLYNLELDPYESIDIYEDHVKIAESLKKELLDWKNSHEKSAAGLDYIFD